MNTNVRYINTQASTVIPQKYKYMSANYEHRRQIYKYTYNYEH
jgi:hypothetical protein